MREIRNNPVGQAVIVSALYIMSCGVLMFLNDRLETGLEVPWTWLWLLWTVVFSPALITTIVASVSTAPLWRRVKILYATSLTVTLATMEAVWIAKPRLGSALVVVGLLCIGIAMMFRAFRTARRNITSG